MTALTSPRPEFRCCAEAQVPAQDRLPYVPPVLGQLGDLRTTCLGGSPGTGDSGSVNTRFPPGYVPPGGGRP